jgi:hypothetical protein
MGWRRLAGLIVLGVSLVALAVALPSLGAGAQSSAVPEEPVCAADAAATVSAQTAGQGQAFDAAYGTGMEALAPGGSRLCVTAAQMRAEAEAAQALQSEQGASGPDMRGAVAWPESCVAGDALDAGTSGGLCGEADTSCGEQPDCGP